MSIEQEIKEKVLIAERVTPQDIEDNIVSEHYFTAGEGCAGSIVLNPELLQAMPINEDGEPTLFVPEELDTLTFCVLLLKNGFTVTGESACASPENFDDEIGRKIARQNAISKVWPLMGYALKEKLKEQSSED